MQWYKWWCCAHRKWHEVNTILYFLIFHFNFGLILGSVQFLWRFISIHTTQNRWEHFQKKSRKKVLHQLTLLLVNAKGLSFKLERRITHVRRKKKKTLPFVNVCIRKMVEGKINLICFFFFFLLAIYMDSNERRLYSFHCFPVGRWLNDMDDDERVTTCCVHFIAVWVYALLSLLKRKKKKKKEMKKRKKRLPFAASKRILTCGK